MNDTTSQSDMTIFTIGHSNHQLETFLDLLAQHGVQLVVDVRSSPYSGYASHFNKEVIQSALHARAVEYLFLGAVIGGRPQGDDFYDEQGYVLYDRLARSAAFQRGIEQLLNRLGGACTVLLCGEEDPTSCHRRLLIGRVLRARGIEVRHIRGDGRIQSEEEIAQAEKCAKTKGQLSLFETEDPDEWKSSRSASPRKPQPNSSRP